MNIYLIAWGESSHAVRAGSGDEKSAAREAFGAYDPKRMTILRVDRETLQSDQKRTRFIAQTLLPAHVKLMEKLNEPDAANAATKEIQKITVAWKREWDKADQRKARNR